MSGLFTRLAQRTLGSAQIARPSVAPRFLQAPVVAKDFSSTEESGAQHKAHTDILNESDQPKLHTTVVESPQNNNQANPQSDHQARQPQQNERHVQIVEPDTVQTTGHVDKFTPVEDAQKDTEAPKVTVETKAQIVPSDRTRQSEPTVIEQQYFTDREPLVDTLLVPVPTDRTQGKSGDTTHFENLGHPMDTSLMPGIDARRSVDKDRVLKQGSNESQTINVTIGRIEVRAVHPATVPIKQNKAKINPALSLDDYLQQRRKGER